MKKLIFFLFIFISNQIFAQKFFNRLQQAKKLYLDNDFVSSEQSYRNTAENAADDSIRIKAGIKRGEVLRIMGRELEDDKIIREIIKELTASKNYPLLLAEAYDEIGELKYYISDSEVAGNYFKKSLAIKSKYLKPNDARLAFSLSNLGRYYNYVQQVELAIYYTRKAYLILKNKPNHLQEINPELIYCEYAYALKEKRGVNYQKNYKDVVRPIYNEALRVNHNTHKKENYWEAYIYHYLGNSYTDEVKLEKDLNKPNLSIRQKPLFLKAIKNYKKAEFIYKKVLPSNNPKLSMTYYVMGLLYDYKNGDPKTSLKYYNESLRQIGFKNIDLNSKSSASTKFKEIYNLHQVLSVISYKIQAESNLYQSGLAKYGDIVLNSTDDLNSIWHQILNEYTLNANSDITTYYFEPPYEDALNVCYNEYKKTHSSYFLNKALNYIENSKYLSFRYLKQKNTKMLTIKELQIKQQLKETFLMFFDGKKYCYQLFMNKKAVEFNRIAVPENVVLKTKSFVQNMEQTKVKDYKTEAYKIYSLFIKNSILNGAKKLTIFPGSKYTCLMPFEALVTNTKGDNFKNLSYLLNKYTTSYYLSLSIKDEQNKLSKSLKNNFIGIAPNNKNFANLTFSEALMTKLNVKYASNLYKSSLHFNQLANLKDYSVVHIATHSYKAENPDSSYLVFTNRKIYLPEIHKSNLTCNLLNLQACETGLGKSIEQNGGLINFVRAFSYAGVRAITSTLWKVDDKSSSEIFENFYTHLNSQGKDEALAMAKKNYISTTSNQTANPFYWAGIVLYGNTNSLTIKEQNSNNFYYVSGIFTGLIILSLAIYKFK
jgi:CHAT domain-containing protein